MNSPMSPVRLYKKKQKKTEHFFFRLLQPPHAVLNGLFLTGNNTDCSDNVI